MSYREVFEIVFWALFSIGMYALGYYEGGTDVKKK